MKHETYVAGLRKGDDVWLVGRPSATIWGEMPPNAFKRQVDRVINKYVIRIGGVDYSRTGEDAGWPRMRGAYRIVTPAEARRINDARAQWDAAEALRAVFSNTSNRLKQSHEEIGRTWIHSRARAKKAIAGYRSLADHIEFLLTGISSDTWDALDAVCGDAEDSP